MSPLLGTGHSVLKQMTNLEYIVSQTSSAESAAKQLGSFRADISRGTVSAPALKGAAPASGLMWSCTATVLWIRCDLTSTQAVIIPPTIVSSQFAFISFYWL